MKIYILFKNEFDGANPVTKHPVVATDDKSLCDEIKERYEFDCKNEDCIFHWSDEVLMILKANKK